MPGFPKLTNGRVDPQLTNILLAYTNDSYIAGEILPTVPNLKEESGKIPEMGQAHLRSYEAKRALWDDGEHRIEFQISNDKSYQIDYYDLSVYVPDRLQEQLQKPFNARNAAQKTVMESLMLIREKALADAMGDNAILTNYTTLSGTSQYTDKVNSNPDTDFDTARDSVQSNIGREANAMYMSRKVANALRRHPFFLEIALQSLGGGAGKPKSLSINALIETLKSWYDLDYVFIGKAINITSNEGQTVSKAAVWGDDVAFFYRPTSPSLYAPSFGYSFQLSGKNMQTRVRRHTEDKGDVVEVLWAYQDKIIDADSAYLIEDAV